MSLRHLFAGIMVGVFTLACGIDLSRSAPDAAFPGVAAADQGKAGGPAAGKSAGKSADDKQSEPAAKDVAREAAEKADNKPDNKADRPVPRERTWAQRLVFPAGNKF